ncbi:MAG: transposase [Chloroflexota bacterium]|nr:transposase [Chloroflexota bacterium]
MHNVSPDTQHVSVPDAGKSTAALRYFAQRRPKHMFLTTVLKLHNPGRRKEQALLRAQTELTRMMSRLLEALREDPHQLRHDGAFAYIIRMLSEQAGGRTAKTEADPTSEAESPAEEGDAQEDGPAMKRAVALSRLLERDLRGNIGAGVSATSVLKEGVFLETAKLLLSWYAKVIADAIEADCELRDVLRGPKGSSKGKQQRREAFVPSVEAVWTAWSRRHLLLEAAQEVVIPFGRHQGKQLKQLGPVGKREARWLFARLLPPDVISATLEHVRIRLEPEGATWRERKAAAEAYHPWRRVPKRQHAVPGSRLRNRAHDAIGEPVPLVMLNETDLVYLYDQLMEMQVFADEYAQKLEAIKVFLGKVPPTYPIVETVPTDEEAAEHRAAYERALDRFYDPFPRNTPRGAEHTCTPQQLADVEADARVTLLRAASKLAPARYQPLSFRRTFRPGGNTSSFALLFNPAPRARTSMTGGKSGELQARPKREPAFAYVLAVMVHPQEVRLIPNSAPSMTEGRNLVAGEEVEFMRRFEQNGVEDLFYVNFPATQFMPTTTGKVMFIPLELGYAYHEQEFLRPTIARAYAEQQRLHLERNDPSLQLSDCLPKKAAIGTARIVHKRNALGHLEFFVHLPVRTPVPSMDSVPTRVIGFHEHYHGLSYAVVTVDGEVMVGDVTVPREAFDRSDGNHLPDSVVHSTVKQMVALASLHGAFPVLEDTSWKKQRTLQRQRNKQQFIRPVKKLFNVLSYKSLRQGLMRPRLVKGVAPTRDCGACGCRSDEKGIQRTWSCRTCGTEQPFAFGHRGRACTACRQVTAAEELAVVTWFLCSLCGHRQLARHNTATVVAVRALHQLIARLEGQQADDDDTADEVVVDLT